MRLSAETIIEQMNTVEAIRVIKEKALTISRYYDNNIKIEINAGNGGVIKLNITEYDL